MRRILAGIVSGIVGGALVLYLGPDSEILPVAGMVALGTYRFIDWLGLLPPPFELEVPSILHSDDTSNGDGKTQN
jgi:hypothetical protein